MRLGACSHSSAERFSLQSPRPAASVSERCSPGLSGSASPSAAAQVICAMMLAPPRPTTFLSSTITRAPLRAAATAANIPAAPAPATSTSVSRVMISSILEHTRYTSADGGAIIEYAARARSLLALRRCQRRQNARRRDRDLAELDAANTQRVIDGVGNGSGRADCTALADALLAKLGVGRRRLHMQDANAGDLGRSRQQIIGKRSCERLAMPVERHLLEQRRADSLCRAAVNLPIHDHRIDQNARVLDHDIVEKLDAAGFGIHGNDDCMRRSGMQPGETIGCIALRDFEPMRIGIAR